MSFEPYRSKGRLSTFLMVLFPVVFGFLPFLVRLNIYVSIILLIGNLGTFILFLIAMNGFAKYYDDSKIFRNSLYPVLIVLIAGNIQRVINFAFITPILEESSILTGLQVVGVLWVGASIVALINGILYRRAFSALAEKSGEDNFKKAGEYMFFGGVLTIVFVGIIGVFIGWILAFKGFSSVEPKSS